MKGERKRKKEKKRTKSPTHVPFGILCSVPYCGVSSSPAAFNLPFYEGMNVITTSPNSNVLDVAVLPYLFFFLVLLPYSLLIKDTLLCSLS